MSEREKTTVGEEFLRAELQKIFLGSTGLKNPNELFFQAFLESVCRANALLVAVGAIQLEQLDQETAENLISAYIALPCAAACTLSGLTDSARDLFLTEVTAPLMQLQEMDKDGGE